MLLFLAAILKVVKLEQDKHFYAYAVEEDCFGQNLALWVYDRGVEGWKTDAFAEIAYCLDLDVL
jgi:hypothetical protein